MHYSPEIFQKDYSDLKGEIHDLYQEKKVEDCLDKVALAARAAYKYRFDQMYDADLEAILDKTAAEFLGEVPYDSDSKKVVFLDSFCWDNKGLSEQYLDALIALDYAILLIVSNDVFHTKGNRIIAKMNAYPKGEFKIYRKDKHLKVAASILNDIQKFAPAKVFFHPSPWDVTAMLVLRKLDGLSERYFIDITDNHFWLGLNTFDHILEFRSYGRQFCERFRTIEAEKIRILPFYPIMRNLEEFKGLPIERTKDTVLAISGGNGYKFLGGDSIYVRLVARLLEAHPHLILIIVGAGKEGELIKQRCPDSVLDRIILEPSRTDIYQLIKHCDLYISSAPRVGGMMNQMALMAEVPVLSFTYNGIKGFEIHPVSPLADISHCDFESEDDFFDIGSRLIRDQKFRTEYVSNFKEAIISKEGFTRALEQTLAGEKPYEHLSMESVLTQEELQKYEEIIVESENHFNSEYDQFLGSHMNTRAPMQNPETQPSIPVRIKRKISHLAKRLLGPAEPVASAQTSGSKATKGFLQEKFKSLGAHISHVPDRYIVVNPQYISIGDRFNALYNLRLEAWDAYASLRFVPELTIGNNVSMNTDVHIGCINKISIGNGVLMASRIYISDHTHGDVSDIDVSIPPAKRELFSKGPVIIEDNVWIGEGVSILPDITIGENSIIGANSVVTKSFPRNSIIAGNPARLLRTIED